MARYDTPGVFDVSPPSKNSADPYGRPVISGHQPMMGDPMVRGEQSTRVTNVPVTMDESATTSDPYAQPQMDQNPAYSTMEPSAEPSPQYQPQPGGYGGDNNQMSNNMPQHPQYEPKSFWRRPLGMTLLILILLLIAYSVVDAFTTVKLPFYVFRKKQQVAQTQTVTPPVAKQNTAPTIPDGFTQFTLPGTTLSFAYPTLWGTPTATTDPGFSQRGGTNKSDGTYAYVVNFATNKDVQIALTSSKYLPAARGALYYDYLQWCVGTADTKIYKSVLHFTTAAKVDTPTTTTCDQGPLADATKLDDTTIVQLKTKDADGKTLLGDLYTKNLKTTDVPVLRVKDATMTNASNIKTMLGTVQANASTPTP